MEEIKNINVQGVKVFEFKNWKKPMLVLKQTIPQQKALDLSFSLAP